MKKSQWKKEVVYKKKKMKKKVNKPNCKRENFKLKHADMKKEKK